RARDGALEDLYSVSTMRAILYSAATTVGSFAALSLSPHRGTASMGLLLTIALAATILAALVVTPALLRATAGWRRG
ncbi:MAG: MMPL family transporter, partial [Rhodospirillales bacterium]